MENEANKVFSINDVEATEHPHTKKKMKLDETPILFTKFDLKIDQDLSKNAKL